MISLKEVVGKGYAEFWNFKGRYRIVKGSRASKKSKTTALYYIANLIKYKDANLLVVRKTYRTLKDSCFRELKWAMRRLGVQDYFDVKESPLEITYLPTGQKIYFRGMDDPLKITSITVEHGYLCWVWIEEAYEISKEEDFNILDESIRGSLDNSPLLFKQLTLTFNPWNEKHWIKRRFFDKEDRNILALTTNYMCNEWLDRSDLEVFENMRINNPKRYKVAGLGEWGIVDGVIYERWIEQEFDINEILSRYTNIETVFGLDFGYTNDPTALFCGLIDTSNKLLYVFDEIYKKGMSNELIYKEIYNLGYAKEKIIADSAEPKSIDRLRDLGLSRIRGARKGKDSVNNGIDYLQNFKIIIHPKCINFLTEISNYIWDSDSKTGNKLNKPIDDFNHLMDAMRYAVEGYIKGDLFSFD